MTTAHLLAFASSAFVLTGVLWDAFDTVILPRTVVRRLRLARVYFGVIWPAWRSVAARLDSDRRRERVLAIFGPLSLLGLVSGSALCLIIGFGGPHWAA